MKFKFAIEETHVKILEVDTGTSAVPQIPKTMEDILNIGRDAYDKLIESGKELPSDIIDSQIFPQCCECGETLNPDDNPARFYDGLMVCESCRQHLSEIDEREYELEGAGINLEEIANFIVKKLMYYNGHPTMRSTAGVEISTIRQLLEIMDIPLKFFCSGIKPYSSFTLNGKEYPI